jgi:hypothetical protein
MARILVAGGLFSDEQDPAMGAARTAFAEAIGREIVQRNNVLLGGCRTGLDATVAKAAAQAARERKNDPRKCIKSWVTKSTKPTHSEGEILRSQMTDWQTVPRGLVYPEPFQEADVIVIIGGWEGTHYAASWARLANKPIVPVATFGLAAAEVFKDELNSFDRRYSNKITLDEYQCLDRLLPDWDATTIASFASEVVCLAERLVKPLEAFIIMSFAQTGELKGVYKAIVRVCKEAGYAAFRVDDHLDPNQRIIPAIMSAIRRSAFIIADVTHPRPNVYYELGYAHALGKDVIVTAKEETKREFDVADVPTLFWDCQDTLEEKLTAQLKKMGICLSAASAGSS